jgi:ribosomal protein L11 methyltransferase
MPSSPNRATSGPAFTGDVAAEPMIRLAVRCRPELSERVLAELLELAPGGVEEERGDGWVEYAIYGPPGEVPDLPDLEAAAGDGLVEITATSIPDDWADRWRDFHRPVVIGDGRLVVRPSWTDHRDTPGREAEEVARIDVVVDPGQAFGTGAHATTALCLDLLVGLADAGDASGPLVDLGTGSGVLAIAGAKLGWGPVSGCDHQEAAIEAAAANARENGVEIELSRVNLREQAPPAAPTMTANLTADLLEEVAARLDEVPDRLVCSGMLSTQASRVGDVFAARGLVVTGRRNRGDWTALLLRPA